MPANKKQEVYVTAATELVPAGSDEGGDDGVPVADCTLGDDESVGTTSSYSWTEAQKETMVEFLQEHDVFYNKSHNQFKNTLIKKQLVEELGQREVFNGNPPSCKYSTSIVLFYLIFLWYSDFMAVVLIDHHRKKVKKILNYKKYPKVKT